MSETLVNSDSCSDTEHEDPDCCPNELAEDALGLKEEEEEEDVEEPFFLAVLL